ncbi:unnamed protein product [Ixodes hexagonus]
MRRRLLLSLVLVSVIGAGQPEQIFSSVAHMNDLVSLERRLVYKVGDFLHRMETKLGYLRSFLNDYYQTTASQDLQLTSSDEIFASRTASPIDAYTTIKRLSVDWNDIVNQFREPDWIEIERLMMESNDTFPRQTDLVDAGEALIRLQKTYRLNVTDMTRGIIMGHQSMAYLSGADCFYFGQLLYNKADYEHATKWFQEALTKVNFEKQPSITPRSIHSYLSSSLELVRALNILSFKTLIILRFRVATLRCAAEQRQPSWSLERKRPSKRTKETFRGASTPDVVFVHMWIIPRDAAPPLFKDLYVETYNALCRGDKLRNASEEKNLFCSYDVPHPYFRIGPVKVEQLSKEPYVVQFYDVIWPQEIKALRKNGDPLLGRATVRETGQNLVSHGRVSQVAWISPDADVLLDRVNARVAMLTGLSTDYDKGDSEIFQYNSYGPGGHYEPHHDYLFENLTPEQVCGFQFVTVRCLYSNSPRRQPCTLKEELDDMDKEGGDRIATFMFYLSDVSLGGSTVFPYAKAGVSPKMGSAAFWYNMREDGSYDQRTLHGACSVLHGTKHVANLWFRTNGQMFQRPCPATRQDS